ncbi:MAG TPA: PEP-CTERM sorting domain-containing protein [Phycisphaerae bacterium]|nr:PEP-CTERM sorting domain-containing protein [Phycisphaerae bacterium]
MIRNVLAAACVVALVVPAMAAPVNFTENWDSYTAGAAPPSPWYADPHMSGGSNAVTNVSARVVSSPNAYQVNDIAYPGADRGDQAMLVGAGESIEATDAAPLNVMYTAKAQTNKNSDWYFEISLGDVHAPDLQAWQQAGSIPLAEPIPVLAYCKPLPSTGVTKTCFFFDGTKWAGAGYFDVNATPETFILGIDTNNMVIGNAGDGPYTVARQYKGNFDRISIYTLNFTVGTWTTIDDISVTGGNIVPEPATVLGMALGTLFLRRRRS